MSMSETHKALVIAMKDECLAIGYSVESEYQVELEFGFGYFDLAAWTKSVFLAIEVERTNSARIRADYKKAKAVENMTELLICVPNPRVRRLVKLRLRPLIETGKKGPDTFVGCLPECVERARSLFFP